MLIHVKNSRCKVETTSPTLIEKIIEELQFTHPDTGNLVSVYDVENNIFPTGCLPRIIKALRQSKIDYELKDLRSSSPDRYKPLWTPTKTLRPEYQVPDLEKMLNTTRGVVKWPTGGGKTLLMTAYAANHHIFPLIVYTGRTFLHKQILDVFKEEFDPELIGTIDSTTVDVRPITIAMLQTVGAAFRIAKAKYPTDRTDEITDAVKSAKVILVDECHHVPGSMTYDIVMKSTGAKNRWGFSATPYRADGLDILIEAACGPTVISRSASELYRMGYLCNADIIFTEIRAKRWNPSWQDWHKAYKDLIIDNKERNETITNDVVDMYWEGRKICVFVNQIRHGKLLAQMFREKLPSSEIAFVEGELASTVRDTVFERVRSGSIRVMVITGMGDEGLDLPPIDGLCIADGGKSNVEKVQQIGRGLRISPGKKNCRVHDYYDLSAIVSKHAAARMEIYQSIEDAWTVSVKSCGLSTLVDVSKVQYSGQDSTW